MASLPPFSLNITIQSPQYYKNLFNYSISAIIRNKKRAVPTYVLIKVNTTQIPNILNTKKNNSKYTMLTIFLLKSPFRYQLVVVYAVFTKMSREIFIFTKNSF